MPWHLQGRTGSGAAGLISAGLPFKARSVLFLTRSVINPAHTLVSSLHFICAFPHLITQFTLAVFAIYSKNCLGPCQRFIWSSNVSTISSSGIDAWLLWPKMLQLPTATVGHAPLRRKWWTFLYLSWQVFCFYLFIFFLQLFTLLKRWSVLLNGKHSVYKGFMTKKEKTLK